MKVNQIVESVPSSLSNLVKIGREESCRVSSRINSISKISTTFGTGKSWHVPRSDGINHFVETRLSRLTDLSRHWKLHRLIRRSTMQTCSLSFSGSLLLFRREIDKLCIQLFMLGGHNRARWLTRSWHALQVLLPLPISFASPRWVPSTRVARVAILNLLACCR